MGDENESREMRFTLPEAVYRAVLVTAEHCGMEKNEWGKNVFTGAYMSGTGKIIVRLLKPKEARKKSKLEEPRLL